MTEKTQPIQTGSCGEVVKTFATTPDTPAHTPLPWATGKSSAFANWIYSGTTNLAFARQDHGRIDETTAKANAAFIVRACNSHYLLVSAAKAIMPRNLNLADWLPDDATIPLDVPVSELRALAAALSQAGGASE